MEASEPVKYIIVDDKIQVNDWAIQLETNEIFKVEAILEHGHLLLAVNGDKFYINGDKFYNNFDPWHCKKIIMNKSFNTIAPQVGINSKGENNSSGIHPIHQSTYQRKKL